MFKGKFILNTLTILAPIAFVAAVVVVSSPLAQTIGIAKANDPGLSQSSSENGLSGFFGNLFSDDEMSLTGETIELEEPQSIWNEDELVQIAETENDSAAVDSEAGATTEADISVTSKVPDGSTLTSYGLVIQPDAITSASITTHAATAPVTGTSGTSTVSSGTGSTASLAAPDVVASASITSHAATTPVTGTSGTSTVSSGSSDSSANSQIDTVASASVDASSGATVGGDDDEDDDNDDEDEDDDDEDDDEDDDD